MKWSAVRRKLGRVDKAIDKAMEKAEMPGAVLLARMPKHDEVIEHASRHGFAVVRPERLAMTRETIFDLASLTKPLATTTAVMLLVNDGAVSLDDPVSKHLPIFSERDKDGVTVRQPLDALGRAQAAAEGSTRSCSSGSGRRASGGSARRRPATSWWSAC